MNIQNAWSMNNYTPQAIAKADELFTKVYSFYEYLDEINRQTKTEPDKNNFEQMDTEKNENNSDETPGFATVVNYQEFYKAWMSQGSNTSYSYTQNKGLNTDENSISLVSGVSITLENNFRLQIEDSLISIVGDIRNAAASSESNKIASAMNSFIKVANGQIPFTMFYNGSTESSKYAIKGLEAAGIDTSKEFIVNDKKFAVGENGQIKFAL